MLPKTTTQTTGGNGNNEKLVVAKKGESVVSILRDLSATPADISAIARVLGPRSFDGGIKEGQKLRILMAQGVAGQQRLQPIRVIIASDSGIDAVVALADTGKYVAVDVKNIDTEVAENSEDRTTKTTPPEYASIKASMRQRCATGYPAPSSTT